MAVKQTTVYICDHCGLEIQKGVFKLRSTGHDPTGIAFVRQEVVNGVLTEVVANNDYGNALSIDDQEFCSINCLIRSLSREMLAIVGKI